MLFWAIKHKNNQLINAIIEHDKFNVDSSYLSKDVIANLIQEGYEEEVIGLLKRDKFGPNKLVFYEYSRRELIFCAIKYNREKVIDCILEHPEFDPNASKDYQYSIILLIIEGHDEKVINLLKNNIIAPDLSIENHLEDIPLISYAIKYKKYNLINAILEHPHFYNKNKEGIILDLLNEGLSDILINFLKKSNFDPNCSLYYSFLEMPFISIASKARDQKVVKFILEHPKFNIDLHEDWKVLISALSCWGSLDFIITLLSKNKISPNILVEVDFTEKPLIFCAIKYKHTDFINCIMKHPHFDPNLSDGYRCAIGALLHAGYVELGVEFLRNLKGDESNLAANINLEKLIFWCIETKTIQVIHDLFPLAEIHLKECNALVYNDILKNNINDSCRIKHASFLFSQLTKYSHFILNNASSRYLQKFSHTKIRIGNLSGLDGLLLMHCISREKNILGGKVIPADFFALYLSWFKLQTSPYVDRVIFSYGKTYFHWFSGEFRKDISGSVYIFINDSIPETPLRIEALKTFNTRLTISQIFSDTFNNEVFVYHNTTKIQKADGCSFFAIDSWRKLNYIHKYLPQKYHGNIFNYFKENSRLEEKNGNIFYYDAQVPMYLLKNWQSRAVFKELANRTEEKDIPINKKGELPLIALESSFKEKEGKKRNFKLDNKAASLQKKMKKYLDEENGNVEKLQEVMLQHALFWRKPSVCTN